MSKRLSPIRKYRQSTGVDSRVLAEKLGISPVTLRSYENGNRRIPAEFAVRFEKKTGVPREQLLPEIFA